VSEEQHAAPVAAGEVDHPVVVAEVAAAFAAYERALVANDVDAMTEAFWDSATTVRYGIEEAQYGAKEIADWRRVAAPLPEGRTLGPTVVTSFGDSFACVSTEFRYPGLPGLFGRQSQTWVRRPEGWRVVAAHVSMQPEPTAGEQA
jgi:hypothetical protein